MLGSKDKCKDILAKAGIENRKDFLKFSLQNHPDKRPGQSPEERDFYTSVSDCWTEKSRNDGRSGYSEDESTHTDSGAGYPEGQLVRMVDLLQRLPTHIQASISAELSIAGADTRSVYSITPTGFQIRDDADVCVFYKYQDPVVRMICEYTIFVLKDTRKTYSQLRDSTKSGTFEQACDQVFKEYSDPGGIEGSECTFGVGLVTCCSTQLRQFLAANDAAMLDDKVRRKIQEMQSDIEYKKLRDVSVKYPELFDYTFIEDKKLRVVQYLIAKIIKKSGRSEGTLPPGMQRKEYPMISVFEVIDTSNSIWKSRCEIFHMSRSPCVHAGMYGESIAKTALHLCGLPSTYSSLIWIHTIAHSLDRLYCGFSHSVGISKIIRSNPDVWNDISASIDIFSKTSKKSKERVINDMFTKIFNVDYGYDTNGACDHECAEIRRVYKCTRGVGAHDDEVKRYVRENDILKCKDTACLEFNVKYYDWYMRYFTQ